MSTASERPPAGDFDDLEPYLDPGIAAAVRILMAAGIETFESCQGGPGHCFAAPTVRFRGHRDQGFHALAVAQANGLLVVDLRRTWSIVEGEPTGPHWELVFEPGLFANLRERRALLTIARRARTPRG